MTTRTAKPELIHTLTDWVNRWPKHDNLEFDSVSREPTVYSPLKRGDPGRTKITNEVLRWKRAGDVMTILSQPTKFSKESVEAATTLYRKYQEERANVLATNIDILRQKESTLLQAWTQYYASPSPTAMQDVLHAQKEYSEMEQLLSEQTHRGRACVSRGENIEMRRMYHPKPPEYYMGIYDPALPWRKRIVDLK